jgi:hypothetical protein
VTETQSQPCTIADFRAYCNIGAIAPDRGLPIYLASDMADRPTCSGDRAQPIAYVASDATEADVIRAAAGAVLAANSTLAAPANPTRYSICGDGAERSPVPAYWVVADGMTPREVFTAWVAVNSGMTVVYHDDTWGRYPEDDCPCTVEEFADMFTECIGRDADNESLCPLDEEGEPSAYPWPSGVALGHMYTVTEAVCHPASGGFGEWDWAEAEEVTEVSGGYASAAEAVAAWVDAAEANGLDVEPADDVSGRLHRQSGGSVYRLTSASGESVHCVWAEQA